jgi:TolB-like protein/DNA-binding winged helix-turn-helix (wHTH) protein/Tfp pilus assembly protein PilF
VELRSSAVLNDFRLGEWVVEPQLNRLSANGKAVHLEPKVMQVLVCLAESGAVVSKEKLMSRVWADTFVTEDVLTRSISELRKAFADDARNPQYIQTIPKSGYRLLVPVSAPNDATGLVNGNATAVANSNANGAGNGAGGTLAASTTLPQPPAARKSKLRTARLVTLLGIALAAVLISAYVAVYLGKRSAARRPQPPPGRVTLAVMPFQNLSNDPQQEYFADGLTAEMISQLGRLPSDQVGVIAWNSMIRYKGVKANEDDVAATLGANYILEGTVRRSGNHVRITAELVEIGQRSHLWANSYDGELGDVLEVQNRVARAIAQEIQLRFTPEQEARLKTPTALNGEGYEAYLKGMFWTSGGGGGIRDQIEHFQKAIALNPRFAAPYNGLANAYIQLASFGYAPSRETYAQARVAAEKALEIDPDSAEAHMLLAWIEWRGEWNFAAAEKNFRRARELGPNNSQVHARYSLYLKSMGRFEESLVQINHALELSPLDAYSQANAGALLGEMHRYDQAMERFHRALEIAPNEVYVHERLGTALLWQNRNQEAIREFEKARELSRQQPEKTAWLAYAYAVSGRKQEAQELLAQLNRIWQEKREYLSPVHMSLVYIGLHDNDSAMRWLNEACNQRDEWLVYLHVYPEFDPLRSDPRFQGLERRVGLAPKAINAARRKNAAPQSIIQNGQRVVLQNGERTIILNGQPSRE